MAEPTETRCVNCGTRRDDLIEHEGALWCPGYGDCDLALYHEQLGRDMDEDEARRQVEHVRGTP